MESGHEIWNEEDKEFVKDEHPNDSFKGIIQI
jgi:hypothetical protein